MTITFQLVVFALIATSLILLISVPVVASWMVRKASFRYQLLA